MPNGHGIKKETFTEADDKTRIAMTFDLLEEIHDLQQKQMTKCEKRFTVIEKRKWYDKGLAGGMGMIAGFAASLFR